MGAARNHNAREIRDQLDEENPLALRLTGKGHRPRISAECRCGAPLDDPTSEICGPCGRDRGTR